MESKKIESIAFCALVLKSSIRAFDEIKEVIDKNYPEIKIIYQRLSGSPLKIIEVKAA